MKNSILAAALMGMTAVIASAQTVDKAFLDGPNAYLGQKPPVDEAVKFNLPVAGGAKAVERIAISNDGREIFYTEYASGAPTIKRVAFADGKWGAPAALFAGEMGPALSPDNNTLYFEDGGKYCWFSARKNGTWSEPARLLSQSFKQHYPVMTEAGRLYVSSAPVVGSRGDVSLVVRNGSDAAVKSLGAPLNSQDNGFDFFMARDESYAVVVVLNRGYGAGDLCVSFKKADGSWTRPQNLGSSVNSDDWEYGPSVSPDDKYIFFTRENGASVYWARLDTVLAQMKQKQGMAK